MPKTWRAPAGTYPTLCADMLKQPHVLIAGATGSGKSVLINSLIYTALYDAPTKTRFILIDPKRVELCDYKRLPHTMTYASEPPEIVAAIHSAVDLMESRYRDMQRRRLKRYDGPDVYIIIDEYADLVTVQKKQVLNPLCRLAQLGRACKIHLIIATQRPTREILSGQIKVNVDARVALRCPTAQDSRNIINIKGAELLPRYGEGYYLTPDTMQPVLVPIPLTEESELERIRAWWKAQEPKRLFKSRFKKIL